MLPAAIPADIAPLLYQEVHKIVTRSDLPERNQVLALATLMERLFFEATKQEQIAFSSLFARISYVGQRHHFQPETLRHIHLFRWAAKKIRAGMEVRTRHIQWGVRALSEAILVLSGAAIPASLIDWMGDPSESAGGREAALLGYLGQCRVVAVEDIPASHCLLAYDVETPEKTIRVLYGLADRNENFMPTIQIIRKVFGFPVALNLLEVDIDQQGNYRPRILIIEPDYLVDVSAIAECFKDTGPEPYAYLVRKFLPYETTEPILIGNIANYFLDRLLNEPQAEWQTLFRETFQISPFVYAPMTDNTVKGIAQKSQKHFLNIKNMAVGGFAQQDIDPEACMLEPAFFSEKYGIQGRLDLFYQHDEKNVIVELKSGTPFKPNNYGIQRSHFTQTLLYDLLIRSVYGQSSDPVKYILYSGMDINQLRFAPTVAPEQWEALQMRNQLVAIERLLAQIQPGEINPPVLQKLRAHGVSGFLARDFALFEQAYRSLTALEKKYFNAFAGFIAREQWLAKIGEENADAPNGHAALWRSAFEEKQESFSLLSHLEIIDNRADQPDPVIRFRRTADTNPLANFRVGDIAVLYPATTAEETVLDHQVIKCTITLLSAEMVEIQLRFRQHNLKPFENQAFWRLEPDMIDTGFAAMYRSLFEWASASPEKRGRLLTTIPPDDATAEGSADLIERMLKSPRFFLLWGPPGTGKTSVVLRDLAIRILNDTDDNVLLLAYTNRAVDEICESLDSIGGEIRDSYIRIGGRHSTAMQFRPQLLGTKIQAAQNRAALRDILDRHRIFVSTVASFSQHEHLLQLKKFQRLIVDEASQILEPQLVGLLTRFDHFVLIGDHQQLPAVTMQRIDHTAVSDQDLREIGLKDLRDAYFERLFRRCEAMGWNACFGKLSHQGRMHRDIMHFPNIYFYGGMLQTLPDAQRDPNHYQSAPLEAKMPGLDPYLESLIATHRVIFLPATIDEAQPGQKTNRHEAELATRLAVLFKEIYAHNGKNWDNQRSLGIITPWRAQIAQIRASMHLAGFDPDTVTIDTVERYQGGARDVIIISTCVNAPHQLGSLVSLSGDGVDRKLNVALTRARAHVILIGNPDLLKRDRHYSAFMELYGSARSNNGESALF